MNEERTIRLFGIREESVRERLADVLSDEGLSVALSSEDEDVRLCLTAGKRETLESAVDTVTRRLGAYIYSTDDTSLEAQTVALLTAKHQTVAVAESCTGGMIASRLTAVPGCSAVFGTGVVSYSWGCKKQMLGVSPDTLEACGAVSAQTAREMADGIRRRAGASIGIATTGEAGPQAAEDVPVGTVFVALADAKRTWVKELHLDASKLDREGIRCAAASHALDLARRYLTAYPTVMAGGERHTAYAERQPKMHEKKTVAQRLVAVLPWRGDRKARILKATAWLSAFTVLVVGVLMIYTHILSPMTNRELQEDLADMYWDTPSDLTVEQPEDSTYPVGMMSQFRSLYDINEDVAGWVRIPDTPINYPITVYADGYYNNHNFNDQFSVYGQPYFYKESARDALQTDRVLAVYGNNTRDEQMFSVLSSYRRIAFLRENPIIEMNTLYEAARWEIFAVAVVDERERSSEFEYMRRNFEDEAAFDGYIEQLRRRSLFFSDATLTEEDAVLLLVTNAEREYGFSGARLVVAARRMTQTESTATYTVNYRMKWPAAYARQTTKRSTTTSMTTASTTTSSTTVSTTTAMSTTQADVTEQTTTTTEQTTTTTEQTSSDDMSDVEINPDEPVSGEPEESVPEDDDSVQESEPADGEKETDGENESEPPTVESNTDTMENNDNDYLGN